MEVTKRCDGLAFVDWVVPCEGCRTVHGLCRVVGVGGIIRCECSQAAAPSFIVDLKYRLFALHERKTSQDTCKRSITRLVENKWHRLDNHIHRVVDQQTEQSNRLKQPHKHRSPLDGYTCEMPRCSERPPSTRGALYGRLNVTYNDTQP